MFAARIQTNASCGPTLAGVTFGGVGIVEVEVAKSCTSTHNNFT